MSSPIFSVVMPAFNSEAYLEEAIRSVVSQSFHDWELIIVDDCSEDNSAHIAKEFSKNDRRIRLITLSSKHGPAGARNEAIKEAEGRYIAFLDSDDMWLPNKLSRQLEVFRKTQAALTYSSYLRMSASGDVTGPPVSAPESVSYKRLLKGNVIGCLTAAYDTQRVGKVYMPDFKLRQDYGLWLSILKTAGEARGVQEPMALYRIHGKSLSSNKLRAAYYQWKIYRDLEKFNIWRSMQLVVSYAFLGMRKRFL